MSDKYIIRNCPCYNNERFIEDYLEDGDNYCPYYSKECQDCTDCVMKQIVEKCRDKMDTEFNSGSMFAEEILNLLQIEEVE